MHLLRLRSQFCLCLQNTVVVLIISVTMLQSVVSTFRYDPPARGVLPIVTTLMMANQQFTRFFVEDSFFMQFSCQAGQCEQIHQNCLLILVHSAARCAGQARWKTQIWRVTLSQESWDLSHGAKKTLASFRLPWGSVSFFRRGANRDPFLEKREYFARVLTLDVLLISVSGSSDEEDVFTVLEPPDCVLPVLKLCVVWDAIVIISVECK